MFSFLYILDLNNIVFIGLSDTMAEKDLLALIKRLETVATKLEKSAPGSATSGK